MGHGCQGLYERPSSPRKTVRAERRRAETVVSGGARAFEIEGGELPSALPCGTMRPDVVYGDKAEASRNGQQGGKEGVSRLHHVANTVRRTMAAVKE